MSKLPFVRNVLGAASLCLALGACDEAKKFMDPTGRAYNTPPDTSKAAQAKAEEARKASQAAAPAAAQAWANSSPASATQRVVPPLTSQSAIEQAGDMLLASGSGWIEFHKGRAVSRGRNLTLWGPSEVPWGMAIVDLDQDGAEDAVFAVRSTSHTDTTWALAVLTDHSGKLQCLQNIPLEGVTGISSLEATQGGVLVTTSTGEPRLFGWVGGNLVGN